MKTKIAAGTLVIVLFPKPNWQIGIVQEDGLRVRTVSETVYQPPSDLIPLAKIMPKDMAEPPTELFLKYINKRNRLQVIWYAQQMARL